MPEYVPNYIFTVLILKKMSVDAGAATIWADEENIYNIRGWDYVPGVFVLPLEYNQFVLRSWVMI